MWLGLLCFSDLRRILEFAAFDRTINDYSLNVESSWRMEYVCAARHNLEFGCLRTSYTTNLEG